MKKDISRLILFTCWVMMLFPVDSFSQEEAAEKAQAKVKVAYSKDEMNVKYLKATVTSKVDKKWQPVENLSISFYRDSISPIGFISKMNTDEKGVGIVELADKFAQPDSIGQMKFFVTIDPNNNYDETEEEIEVRELTLKADFTMEDSIGKVIVTASESGMNGEATPIADVEVNVYVKRMFSLLKIGAGTTDENGSAEIEIPNDIPGDATGLIEIITKVEDHDLYGTVAATCGEVQCGIPLLAPGKSRSEVRALWSPNAPLWMVITFGILMTGVWGHFCYIIYSLFRIKKIGADNSNKAIIWNE